MWGVWERKCEYYIKSLCVREIVKVTEKGKEREIGGNKEREREREKQIEKRETVTKLKRDGESYR